MSSRQPIFIWISFQGAAIYVISDNDGSKWSQDLHWLADKIERRFALFKPIWLVFSIRCDSLRFNNYLGVGEHDTPTFAIGRFSSRTRWNMETKMIVINIQTAVRGRNFYLGWLNNRL